MSDRVPARHRLGCRHLPAAGPAGPPGPAARDPRARRPAADGPAGRRQAGDQPEHGAQGLPGPRTRGPGAPPARPGDVHRRDAPSQRPRRPGALSLIDDHLAAKGARCRPWSRRHRGDLPHRRSQRLRGRGGMTAIIETKGLGKRYGRKWALRDCALTIPEGKVVGLVGPNGAGKTTLLHLAVGLLAPTSGSITVLGGHPGNGPAQLERVGFVAQDTPTYAGLSVAKHLRMGAYLNRHWDSELAESRIGQLGLDPRQKAGSLSGGERAQLALTLAVARRPELLLLDEPVASLDPLARREFLQSLMEIVAKDDVSVMLSSHLIADLERVCDYLVILMASHVLLSGEVTELLASHWRLTGPRRDPGSLPSDQEVIEESHTDKQSMFLVRTDQPVLNPAWNVKPVTLEDLVLAYLSNPRRPERVRSHGFGVVR